MIHLLPHVWTIMHPPDGIGSRALVAAAILSLQWEYLNKGQVFA